MYFLSLFVIEFLRHWQLYQLRWNTPAGIESHMLRQGHAKVSPCGVGGETEMRNSARSMVMVPQTLETPIGCWASQSLGGNAWREGSWISLEIMRPMTHQLLEATDVGKSAGCLNPWGSTSSCRTPHLTGKHGKKQWEKQLGSASAHGHAPRVKSRFATLGGSALRSSPKMLKTRPLPTTAVFRACGPSCEMCQWNNDLLRWWCMIKPNN